MISERDFEHQIVSDLQELQDLRKTRPLASDGETRAHQEWSRNVTDWVLEVLALRSDLREAKKK